MDDDFLITVLWTVVMLGIAALIGNQFYKDTQLTKLCLSNGYSEQRRVSDDMYCVKRGEHGETIVTNAKDLK